ncbi:MAG TPA: GGDEF domain-containing protein [Sphingobium sp.]|uniref:GGDEF domain-containing protein n=1 Tax=unclassified Sphingobium TaxID=2611147 RepID=UPI000ED71F21|nr:MULTISPECIES: GGDEF domain-containing protein [unclassified Sphingobium]WIW88575.1 GGDEF domain-containing protein [Sphingobium sp. V4]HAF43064.1 GGDEF domain-containing protein [Sphingobium sp.]
MQFYLATSFIFPRSLRLRLFALCFVATHMPLLGYLAWGFSTGRIALAEFVLLTLATVAGTAVALLGIGAMLNPIQALAETLNRGDRAPAALPEVGDVIQTLYAGVQRAASATQARIDDLHNAAHEDMLTGVANRRGFLSQIDRLPIERRKGCVALIDIDYFKRVNDQLGHDEGDRVLGAFAARLTAQLRRIDIVARWGGEEFAIFFQDSIEDEVSWSLARVASRMRSDPIGLVNGRPISFSAGICRWKGDELEEALRRADEALYEAKQGGRDRICRAAPLLQEV